MCAIIHQRQQRPARALDCYLADANRKGEALHFAAEALGNADLSEEARAQLRSEILSRLGGARPPRKPWWRPTQTSSDSTSSD